MAAIAPNPVERMEPNLAVRIWVRSASPRADDRNKAVCRCAVCFSVAPHLLPSTPRAHERTEYEFQLMKEEQPNARKRLTRREVLVKGLGFARVVLGITYFYKSDFLLVPSFAKGCMTEVQPSSADQRSTAEAYERCPRIRAR